MDKETLLRTAHYVGNLILDKFPSGNVRFHEITHYFNENMEEIGLIAFKNDRDFENVHIFNPVRVWDKSYLKGMDIRENYLLDKQVTL